MNVNIDETVQKLLSKMTLEEKLAQLRSVWIYELLEDGRFSKEKAEKVLKHGIGQITRLAGASNFSPEETAKIAYEIWTGGVDLLKDDENLSSLKFNKFEKRVEEVFKVREKAEAITGERRSFLVNVTAETKEMIRRARFVSDIGGEYIMIDIITTGWAALQTMREVCEDYKLAIHAHRAMHASFTRNPKHGISMYTIAKAARLVGVDQIHTGTVVGKLVGTEEEVEHINKFLRTKWGNFLI